MKKVLYIGSGDAGIEMFLELLKMPCEIAWDNCCSLVPLHWPEYDFGINFLGSQRIPAPQLYSDTATSPHRRWLNFHPAPLPAYGGRNVAYHALMNGERQWGGTLHWMDEEFDTGPIVEVERYWLLEHEHAGDLMRGSIECLKRLFRRWVPVLLEKGRDALPSMPQDLSKSHYYAKQPIMDYVSLPPDVERIVRALTCPPHHARTSIFGRAYKIVPDEEG